MSINKICIVGYGAHTRNTLIPSFKKIKDKNLKIVSSKIIESKFQVFNNLKIAFKYLNNDYFFYNSTPPENHYNISKQILLNGYNLIVEKPICVNLLQLNKLIKLAKSRNLILIENMMYFYTKQFKKFSNVYFNNKQFKSLKINFCIPTFSKNTFRSKNKSSILLFDVFCYPLSLLSFLNINLHKYDLFFKYRNNFLSTIILNLNYKGSLIKLEASFFKIYKNNVKITYHDNSYVDFEYFFYGKNKCKTTKFYKNKKFKYEDLDDINSFSNILNFKNEDLKNLSRTSIDLSKIYIPNFGKIKKKLANKSY